MITVFKNLFKKQKPLKLGRWNVKNSNDESLVKVIYTNADHCGDLICGNPYKVAEIIEHEKKIITKKVDNN